MASTQLTFRLGGSHRQWNILRRSDNPFGAAGGPLPEITIPLEARITEPGIDIQFLRLDFDLKLGPTLVGQGVIGPCMNLRTFDSYIPAKVTCPQAALAHLINPPPPQGRITLSLVLRGLLRYRHSFPTDDDRAQGLAEAGVWHTESIGEQGGTDLDVQVARSDWYEQVVEKLGIASYLVTPVYLPYGLNAWEASLRHLDSAQRAFVEGNPPAVFGFCRAAIDALPGAKTNIFDAMPEGKKRDAIDELTKHIGAYFHSGRHVVPNSGGEQAGDFPVDQRDALFAYNVTKLLLSQIYALVSAP